jgi:threonine synthase
VAWSASEIVKTPFTRPDTIVATASPLKFSEEIYKATKIKVDNTMQLEALTKHPEHYIKISNSYKDLKYFLQNN